MIYLDRHGVKAPDILTKEGGAGLKETAEAIYSFTGAGKEKGFKFAVYRHPEVKAALMDLCHRKCAYCESKETGSDYDVEHFRPKGMVTRKGKKISATGYYWLAATWDNLFISCQHCNQSRVQEFPGEEAATAGKKNEFPLSDESKRVTTPLGDLTVEDKYRLLLNPSLDRPEQHLSFTVKTLKGDSEGETPKNFMFVDAKEDEHGVPSAKGSMSLLVFGLNRKVLQEERHKEYIALTLMMNDAAFFIDMLNEDGDSMSEERRLNLQGRISNLLTELHVRRRNDQRFSAMTRFFVDDFLSKYGLTE